jgi:predicted permease
MLLGQDLQFAWRQIRRSPGFAASAVLTLAIGVGANTGIFSLQNGYLRPLPVPAPDRIVVLTAHLPGDDTGFRYRFSYPAFNDYRQQVDQFSDVLGFDARIGGLMADGRTTQFVYEIVTGNYFSALRLSPLAGRFFEPGEGEFLGAESTIVLGHEYWRKRFGGDPGVVGRTVRLDGVASRIVGIAPPGFHGLNQGVDIEGYATLGPTRGRSVAASRVFADRTFRHLTLVARLKPRVTIAEAQASVDVVTRRLQSQYAAERDVTAEVMPEQLARPVPMRFLEDILPLIRGSMLGLAALVLLIACMNVANLLLVRATVRQREMAVRSALGSARSQLVRLLLAESLLLALGGTAAGLVAARWATGLFVGSLNLSMDLPLNLDFDYDWRVFAYAAAIAAITGVLMGVVPAVRASRVRISALLHDGGYGSVGPSRQRLRSALVVAQVAGSLVLLVVAGLFVRSLQRAQWIDLGFDPTDVLTVRIDPHQVGYDETRAALFYDELERRLRAVAGVEATAMSFSAPLGYIFDGVAISREQDAVAAEQTLPAAGCNSVSPAYFDVLRIPIVDGRGITDQDVEGSAQVVVVNQTLAKMLWPNERAVGKMLYVRGTKKQAWQVAGIARDSKYLAVFETPLPHLYFPLRQRPFFMRVLYVRSKMAPDLLGPRLQQEIQALDGDVPIADLKTLRQMVQGGMSFLLFRVGVVQAGAMGVLGLLLAIVGLYGVVSYGAAQRTREMGIRLALGAAPADVRGLVLRQGVGLICAGIVAGLLISTGVTRIISKFFVLVSSTDLATFLSVTVMLSLIALAACYLPARRAMRVDPVVALRHE